MTDRHDRIRKLELLKLRIYSEMLEKRIEELEDRCKQMELESDDKVFDNTPQGIYNKERHKLLALNKRYQNVNQEIDELSK